MRELHKILERANSLIDRLASSPLRAAALIVVATVLIRTPALFDPNHHVDEGFYLLVGDRMRAGSLLYVDIWDRKPPGIFLINMVVGALWPGIVGIHVAALISVIAAAMLVFKLAGLATGPRGAVLAALGYVAFVGRFGGAGAQTPVFYNTGLLLAAWLIASRMEELQLGRWPARLFVAALAIGCAIAIKPVAAAEGGFMCLFALAVGAKAAGPGRTLLRALALAAVAASPLVASTIWYAAAGHFQDFWESVVTSNFRRHYMAAESVGVLWVLLAQVALPLGMAFLGLWFGRERLPGDRQAQLRLGWCIVALAAFLAFPNKADHYVLPLAAPFVICAAPFLNRSDVGLVCGGYMIGSLIVTGDTINLRYHIKSQREMEELSQYIRNNGRNRGLFVYAGPAYIYHAAASPPLGPLAFPPHLFDRTELDVSRFSTFASVHEMLARNPGTIVRQTPIPAVYKNDAITSVVDRYAQDHCSVRRQFRLRDMYSPYRLQVYTRCSAALPHHNATVRIAPSAMATP